MSTMYIPANVPLRVQAIVEADVRRLHDFQVMRRFRLDGAAERIALRSQPNAGIGRAIESSFVMRPSAFHPRSYCGGTASASVRPSAAAARNGQ